MSIVIGKVCETYSFREDDIKQFVGNDEITTEQVSEIADILAANVESPDQRADGTIDIIEENFNDAFFDMQEDLTDQYR